MAALTPLPPAVVGNRSRRVLRSVRLRSASALLAGLVAAGCTAPPGAAPPASTPQEAPVPATGTQPGRTLDGAPLGPIPSTAGAPSWAPWPSALHDARHSATSAVDGPTTGTVRWRRSLEGPVTPGPVVGPDGTIYAASNAGVLHALDPRTGADRWTYDSGRDDVGADLSTSPLVLADGTVLWGASDDGLVALSGSGAVLGTVPLPGVATSPVSADGRRVYVGDTGGGVTALDVLGGVLRRAWSVRVGSSSYGSVVTDGSGRLYTTAGSSLVAVDDRGDSGQVAWRADPGDDITEVSAGLAPDGTALLGTNGAREWAYRPDGTPLWNAPRVITYSSPAVTPDGLAYVADHSGRVRVLRVADGTEAAAYQLDPPDQIWSSVAVDRGRRLYFGTLGGHLLGVSPSGVVLFDLGLGGPVDSYPALTGDGALVVGDRDGTVVAVG